ncbi:SMP-30/gluconolactonase/LRE family protein [Blastopirellula sp. JC732]|uniref:SMP-30/gluconolactonase/LRE family protein n=1 Tax=Blastopirellula sediminis TaxID=2894196 RepID=A0A9X1MHE1_9BACT|nr:SMP-30/gluconolactonase/LRE family protein [Blastopirellula sediminis]MCC9608079.1 SMP-30/gluconolactonase/LRE family protein [Blastopirellula sediminis]MCC9627128.1 SMP-30/gluconolactonase/LRE family protein [Blastopirellula sediminis]
MKLRHFASCSILLLSIFGASLAESPKVYPTFGKIIRLDPRLDAILPPDAQLEKLASGFEWSEGPVWVPKEECLLFSDIPNDSIMRWSEKDGLSLFMKPAGQSGAVRRGTEPGSNGLLLDAKGNLVLCQHGDRQIARLEGTNPKSMQTVLSDSYQGKRLNSPNDGAFKSNGDLYFTDPPYGLKLAEKDPARELPYSGIFRLTPQGELTLLNDKLTFPNGLAFSPDETKLYVAQSDPKAALWMVYDVKPDGTLSEGKVFFDATQWVATEKGLPDGLKVDAQGNVFATAPGGVFIFAPDGTHLGTIATGEATGNCAWGDDGTSLYINADMYLGRVKTKTRGAGW